MSEFFGRLKNELEPLRKSLLAHPLYGEVNTIERLRGFMQIHVFAVWDFMSLVKRLQRDLTCVELPWVPPRSPTVARFVNEVILSEESDVGPEGAPGGSHLELYLRAMDEVGADTRRFREFLMMVVEGVAPSTALDRVAVPGFLRTFVADTLSCAQRASTTEVASAFLFGREDLIPEMFERLLAQWGDREAGIVYFAYYLRRHIELDSETHGPLAERLLIETIGKDEEGWRIAGEAASRAIQRRIDLWDGIRDEIRSQQRPQS
jgi:hypothetical protein